MSHLNWKIHYSLADSHKRYLVLKYKRWHGCKLFFWDSGNPTWHWGKRRGTSSVWRNVNVQLNLFPCLSDLKHTDNVWSGFVLTSWRGQAVRRGGIASLCCTWLGTKAIHWSILMHLPSEDQLRNAPSVSALTRRLRVTGDFKGLLLFWNQIEMPFRSINPPASAVALQIGGESVFLSQIWQQIITLNGSTEHNTSHSQMRSRHATRLCEEWNLSSFICGLCRVTVTWCFGIFFADMSMSVFFLSVNRLVYGSIALRYYGCCLWCDGILLFVPALILWN